MGAEVEDHGNHYIVHEPNSHPLFMRHTNSTLELVRRPFDFSEEFVEITNLSVPNENVSLGLGSRRGGVCFRFYDVS